MLYSDEQIKMANSQSIVSYFSAHGYKCEREGREIHIRGFGGLKVKPDTNEYYNHTMHKGGRGLINCLRDNLGMSFPEAMREALNGEAPSGRDSPSGNFRGRYSPPTPPQVSEKKEVSMPEKADNCRRVFAYLIQKRHLSADIISDMVRKNLLYQDSKGNAVFVHYDKDSGKAVGAELHGTSDKRYIIGNTSYSDFKDKSTITVPSVVAEALKKECEEYNIKYSGVVFSEYANVTVEKENAQLISDLISEVSKTAMESAELRKAVDGQLKNFKGIADGTANSYFEYSRGKPHTAYVFESAIDLMSFVQMHPEADNCKFISMAGLKPSIAEEMAKQGLRVIACVDRDEAGKKFCDGLASGRIGLRAAMNRLHLNYEMQTAMDIPFAVLTVEGRKSFMFESERDLAVVKDSLPPDCKKYIPQKAGAFFVVDKSCDKMGVKDFNEMLSAQSVRRSITQDFSRMDNWCNAVQDKIRTQSEMIINAPRTNTRPSYGAI